MVRVLLAIWAGKLAGATLRALGRAGTHVPGIIARKVHPGIIGAIAHPPRVIAVTGTNGKTTASNLLAAALAAQDQRVASNRNGSNLAAGVTATLISAVDWRGRSRVDVGVFEMDERSAKLILPGLRPDVLVGLNLTRDSIKRNAHPSYIAWILSSAVPSTTTLVLNADDLLVADIGGDDNPRVFFAVDRMPTDGDRPSGAAVDVTICPVCDHGLTWDYWRYNHIGAAHCEACGFRSPEAAYRAREVDAAARRVVLDLDGETRTAALVNENIVNVYNQVAVAAALGVLGFDRDTVAAAFDQLAPPETRFMTDAVGATRVVRILTKGLVGVACSRAFDYLRSFPGRKSIVLSIDEVSERTADVENTAWTYDADYDYLADDSIRQIVVGGIRRHDQALRLAIAGVDPERIVTVESETDTADVVTLDGIDAVFNLHSVHNAELTGTPVQARLRARLADREAATR